MRLFILRIFIFSLPILVFIIPPSIVSYYTLENFNSLDNVIIENPKYLIGYKYNEINYKYLKWKTMVVGNRVDVIALGSSRVLQFRGEMFSKSFYNAGYTIEKITEFSPFLHSIPDEKLPSIIIMGLDQWMFNGKWDDGIVRKDKSFWANSFRKQPNFDVLFNISKEILAGKLSRIRSNEKNGVLRIGLNALLNDVGFRNDGSMNYGIQLKYLLKNDSLAYDLFFTDTYSRIWSGTRQFRYGNTVNDLAVTELKKLLVYCKSKDIQVVAFLPPFPTVVIDEMTMSQNYNYMSSLYKELHPIFNELDYKLFDFTKDGSLTLKNGGFIDGFHGGEVVYQNMLIKMAGTSPVLNSVVNQNKLKMDIENRLNDFIIYRY